MCLSNTPLCACVCVDTYILYRPLLLLPSIFPSIRVFSTSLFFASGGQSTGVSASASVLPNGRESLYRGRQIAVRSLGWALVPYDWCTYQRGRVDTDTLSRGEHLVKRWRWRFYEVKSGEGYSKPRKAGDDSITQPLASDATLPPQSP